MLPNSISSTFSVGGSGVTSTANVGGAVSTGTRNYNDLKNKPSIENVTLEGNKNFEDFGAEAMSASEVLEIFNLF